MKILISFFLLIASCKQNSYSRVNIIPVDTLKIKSIFGDYFDKINKKNYLYSYSYVNDSEVGMYVNKITFYDEKTLSEEFHIDIDTNIKLFFYSFVSPDSIFAIDSYRYILYHFDRKGLANKWELNVFYDELDAFIQPYPALLVNANEFYFDVALGLKDEQYIKDRKNFYKQKFMGKFKIVNNKITNPQLFLNLPNDYWQDSVVCTYLNPEYTSAKEGEIVVSFHMNDSLWVINGEKLTKYPAKSKYIDASIRVPVEYNENTAEEYRRYSEETGYYQTIRYDKYRGLYYRIVFHNQKKINEDGTISKNRPWSVIVLDKNFNYIDEIMFSAKEYSSGGFLPTSSGIVMTKRIDNGLFEEEGKMRILYKLELE